MKRCDQKQLSRIGPLGLLLLVGMVVAGAVDRDYLVVAREGETAPQPIELLFFGRQENSHHNPAGLYARLAGDFVQQQIRSTFSTDLADLELTNLQEYDVLMMYGNILTITTAQEDALTDFVEGGGGLVGVHVTSWTVRNSPPLTALLGGRFLGHHTAAEYTEVFHDVSPPILDGLEPYTSVDEPYLHRNLNTDITVLSSRTQGHAREAVDFLEPYTWVRTQGAGRVFYHAGGHDDRTWSQPGYRELLWRGVKWAAEPAFASTFENLGLPGVSEQGEVMFPGSVDDGSGNFPAAIWGGVLDGPVRLAKHGETADTAVGEGDWILPESGLAESGSGSGEVFLAKLDGGVNGISSVLVSTASGLPQKVIADGDPVVGLDAGIVVELGDHFSSSSVGVLLGATLSGAGVTSTDDTALLLAASGVVEVIAREGDQVPDLSAGIHFGDLSSAGLSAAGDGLAMVVPLDGASVSPSDDTAILHRDMSGQVTALRESAMMPTAGAGIALGEIGEASVAGGEVVLDASITGAPGPGGSRALLHWVPGSSEPQVRFLDGGVAEGAPGGAYIWDGVSGSWACNEGGDVLVAATLAGSTSASAGVWRIDAGGGVNVVALEGADVPWESGVQFGAGLEDAEISLADEGNFVLVCDLAGGFSGRALLLGEAGMLAPIFVEGDQIDGLTVEDFGISSGRGGQPQAIQGGRLAFRALTGGLDSVVLIGALDDLDGDGYVDLLERAFGTDPDSASDGLLGEPEMASTEGGALTFEFRRRINSVDFDYIVETSNDLISWLPVLDGLSLAADQSGLPAGLERVQLSLDPPSSRQFMRVRVDTR